MKGYRGWARSELIFIKQLNMWGLSVFLCGMRLMCMPAVAHFPWKNKRGTLQTFWYLGESLYQNICRGVPCDGVPELISHLLWFIAAIRTAYCPCRWIGAVRRRKEQCWAKHQRYSQNVLCLPHTRTLFHLFINTTSECRFGLKTNTEENLSKELTTCCSWMTTELKSHDQAFLINHTFTQAFPQTDY